MGYYVKAKPEKKSLPKWKVQYISWKRTDTNGSTAKKPKKEWDIPQDRWGSLGFHAHMSLDDARVRARQLNSQATLKRQEELIQERAKARNGERLRFESILPEPFVEEFEKRFVRSWDSQTIQGRRNVTRSRTRWRAAQRLIVSIGTEPSEWFYHTDRFYDYFYNQQMSPNYANSILKIANLWGFFVCRKMARPFLPVQNPKGNERRRIIEANFTKKMGVARASHPISPVQLKAVIGCINKKNYNWLHLSIWLGLRPKEVDLLHDKRYWRLEKLSTGSTVLWVFQTKIVSIPPEERWKPIPILFEEQQKAIDIILRREFARPLPKTLHRYFGKGVTSYGGRKGFTDLMLARGQSIENISVWMGHSTLQRTWMNYKQRRRFHVQGFSDTSTMPQHLPNRPL